MNRSIIRIIFYISSFEENNNISIVDFYLKFTPYTNCFANDDLQKPGWRSFLSFVGPGFLVSLAYLDPGNSKY